MSIRLLIADDHELVREGLRAIFAQTDIDVVGEATNCHQAIELANIEFADVMLLDIGMPGGDGFDVLQQICPHPAPAVVMFSVHEREHYVRRARELGAQGYLTKRASRDQLLSAIRAAKRGESYFPHSWLAPEVH